MKQYISLPYVKSIRTKERTKEWRETQKQRTIVTVGEIEATSVGLLDGEDEIVGSIEGFEVGVTDGKSDIVGTTDGFDVGDTDGEEDGLSSSLTQ